MICDLNLCTTTYTFRALSNGFGLPPSDPSEISFTATLLSESKLYDSKDFNTMEVYQPSIGLDHSLSLYYCLSQKESDTAVITYNVM